MMSHKKIHRFLVESLPHHSIGETLTIIDQRLVHQLYRVLHLQPGEQVIVFVDGGDDILGEIVTIDTNAVTIHTTGITSVPHPARTIIAAISIIKGDAFELIVQKLTELGVSLIIPIVSSRTIKQNVRIERLQAISDEALEQSGGTKRVIITEPKSLEETLTAFPYQSIVFDPISTVTTLGEKEETLVCFVGPEGGWSAEDEALFAIHGAIRLCISERILRTETAAIVGIYTLLWNS